MYLLLNLNNFIYIDFTFTLTFTLMLIQIYNLNNLGKNMKDFKRYLQIYSEMPG